MSETRNHIPPKKDEGEDENEKQKPEENNVSGWENWEKGLFERGKKILEENKPTIDELEDN